MIISDRSSYLELHVTCIESPLKDVLDRELLFVQGITMENLIENKCMGHSNAAYISYETEN